MRAALRENELGESFEDVAVADDDDAAPQGASTTSPPTPPRGPRLVPAIFWRHLVPTGDWSTGYTLAVSYGRFDVTGWCDSPGALCAWNLRRADIDPHKPDHVMETSDCLQCVAFHPEDPALVAAGSLTGGVYVFDLGADDEGADLSAREAARATLHIASPSRCRWTRNVAEASRAAARVRRRLRRLRRARVRLERSQDGAPDVRVRDVSPAPHHGEDDHLGNILRGVQRRGEGRGRDGERCPSGGRGAFRDVGRGACADALRRARPPRRRSSGDGERGGNDAPR